MAVEVILLEDVGGLGKLGDQVRVAEGYARNYLFPKSLAASVTPENLRRLEAMKLRVQKEHQERLTVAQMLADKISKLSLAIPVEANDQDKLYGSVQVAQILTALADEGIEIDKSAIVLQEPLQELGVYTLEVNLHPEVKTQMKVWVVRA